MHFRVINVIYWFQNTVLHAYMHQWVCELKIKIENFRILNNKTVTPEPNWFIMQCTIVELLSANLISGFLFWITHLCMYEHILLFETKTKENLLWNGIKYWLILKKPFFSYLLSINQYKSLRTEKNTTGKTQLMLCVKVINNSKK